MTSVSRTLQVLSKIKPLLQGSKAAATQAPNFSQKRTFTAAKPFPVAQYGGRFTVTMVPGDGIGPEMMGYVQNIFRYAGVPVDFEEIQLTKDSSDDDFNNALICIKRNGVALKGSIESKYGDNVSTLSRNVALRTELDLFANVLHCKSYPGVRSKYSDVDIILVRQNTEGEYAMLEHENVKGVIECLKIITRSESERLAKYAFEYALKYGRKKVTIVHKANIMKLSDGLFLQTCRDVAKNYPDIEFSDMIVDNTCMQLVSKPQQFDVVVMPNLYGNVVSNIICGLVGGAGLISGRNYGDHFAVFEPGTRNTGTAIAGRNIANPVAMLVASCDMLEHLGLQDHANLILNAIYKTLNVDMIHTQDLGGQATSLDVIQNVIKSIRDSTASAKW
ncbi:isocitrate dehydrogenase [NAD] subunit gamma, mitochondrial isoform X1 [Macrobrachium rosenbergii]|uniref:isocitrate dehydrogenase [NAD] subunit gamma, mitochondrial isoform X1 n=2 Tax=Macrobrachium rosenbergii TaxID=79674 RepID=UPI0034D407C6